MLALSQATLDLVRNGRTPKGDVLASARLAGIMAAKRTSELIPLAHPLPITHASVELTLETAGIAIEATVATTAQTGVEMEALTAVTVAGLTLYDMLKAIERGARLTDVRLVAKSGGRSGDYRAP
jgi:cyclic pyranopterin phosphate synthase